MGDSRATPGIRLAAIMLVCPGCGEENPAKFRLCGYCGTALAPAPLPSHQVRKTVTVVFSDLKDSTALGERLDPESLRDVMDLYFGAMAAEITRHGGKIEKFIGDAIMAVFGLPRAHEDDALRAVRAAVGMREALKRVNTDLLHRYGTTLAARCGVNTGEVVASDDASIDQKLAIGDAINVAARLEQAAGADEILLGASTYRLVRDAVEVEPVAPLELKGKSERVAAFRLLAAAGQMGSARRQDTPVVGREAELSTLEAAYRSACAGRAIRLVTIVGDAGMGKSRLVHEVLKRVAPEARVLLGRCLPYGDGITFWPLREMVSSAAGIRADDAPAVAQAKVLALVGDTDVADRLAAATGLVATPYPLPEIYWAARKFVEVLTVTGPLVALIDDIHWAEPAFLDLLEHLLDSGAAAPALLLATARPDLLEERTDWSQRPGAERLVLEPLSSDAAAQVVGNLIGTADLPGDVVHRIVDAAEGNPLFVEQMLSMLIETRALRQDEGRWVRGSNYAEIAIPPTIQALLEARLDRLGRDERATVEPASVIGVQFALPAVAALAPEGARAGIGAHLAVLTRKQFIEPTATSTADADVVFRFHHHLVRETVYSGLLKRSRASLHIDFVRWADGVNAERGRGLEFEEVLGYHLEQAHRYLAELGLLDERGRAVGADAARRLGAAGKRAFSRGDMHAATNLLRRAAALRTAADPDRPAVLRDLGEALMELGDFAEARTVLADAVATAQTLGNHRVRIAARLVGMLVRLYSAEAGDWSDATLRLARESIAELDADAAHAELAMAWRLISFVHGVAGRYRQLEEPLAHWRRHAREAGDERLVARSSMSLAISALLGPASVPLAIAQCERILADGLIDRQVESKIICTLALLHAMAGDFDTARALCQRGRALSRELGQGVNAASTGMDLAQLELLAGDLAGCEAEVRADYDLLARMGETYYLATTAALLSRVVRDQGRDADALAYSRAAEAASSADDVETQALWRSVRAPIVARGGDVAGGEVLAREALALARQTEIPMLEADALFELAAVLQIGSRGPEAAQALEAALAAYRAKGDVVSAGRAAAALGRLEAG